jgi:hypothetical protein
VWGRFITGYSWDFSPDGERFLVVEETDQFLSPTELQVLTPSPDRLREAFRQK